MSNYKIKLSSILVCLVSALHIYAEEPTDDHSVSNYAETNTRPVTNQFPVDIYCPAVPDSMPWSVYGGVSLPLYKSPISHYVSRESLNYIVGMTKDLGDYNSGYTTIYTMLEARTYASETKTENIDYRLRQTNFNFGFGIEQGLWTRSFLIYLNAKPGWYQSLFQSSGGVQDDSYQVFFEGDTGFRIYFVRNDNNIFYMNLNLSVDLKRTNSVTLEDGSTINTNQAKLFPGIEFGFGF